MEIEDDRYTKDGTVDRRGNPADKTRTGNWRTSPYILGSLGTPARPPPLPPAASGELTGEVARSSFAQGPSAASGWRTTG